MVLRSPPQGYLRLSGPGFDWGGWFTDLAARKVQGVTTDDDLTHLDRVLLPILRRLAWERPPERRGPSCWRSGKQ